MYPTHPHRKLKRIELCAPDATYVPAQSACPPKWDSAAIAYDFSKTWFLT